MLRKVKEKRQSKIMENFLRHLRSAFWKRKDTASFHTLSVSSQSLQKR